MPEEDLPSFDSLGGPESIPDQLHGEGVATQTIDLSSLFNSDVYSSGTFDLSGVGSTSFGRLLDALPVPAILIDHSHLVVFSNQGCARLTCDYHNLFGVPFLDLVPRPSDRERAQVLADKTLTLLNRVFKTRKPLTAEAILEIHRKRIWTRLHLRAVRIASERYVLVLIEDVTHEKKQLVLNKRRDKESHELRRDLEMLVDVANSQLSVVKVRLSREVADHRRTQQLLKVERQKCEILSDHSKLATGVINVAGAFQLLDTRLQELCGYEFDEIPSFDQLLAGTVHHSESDGERRLEWPSSFVGVTDEGTIAQICSIVCRNNLKREVRVRAVKLVDGNYFVFCEEKSSHDRQQLTD